MFLFTTASRTALGPTQPPTQWVPGAVSLEVKRPGREADHSPPSNAEVKKWVELYLHSLTRLHGGVLSQSTGTTLPLPQSRNFWIHPHIGWKERSYFVLFFQPFSSPKFEPAIPDVTELQGRASGVRGCGSTEGRNQSTWPRQVFEPITFLVTNTFTLRLYGWIL
jgi:hypothetical protein